MYHQIDPSKEWQKAHMPVLEMQVRLSPMQDRNTETLQRIYARKFCILDEVRSLTYKTQTNTVQ